MGSLFSSDQDEHIFRIGETSKHFNTRDQIHEGSQHLLEHSSKVIEIVLSQNSYGVEACKAIAESISQCKNLRVANFSDMFTGRLREEVTQSMAHLSAALLECPKLEVLNLSDNAFGPDGVNSFSALLEQAPNLKELNVTNNGLGPEGARLIAESLRKNPNLKLEVFSAGRDRLENPGIIELAQVFGVMQSLRKISVPQNGIRKEGMVALFRNLMKNPEMQIIEVNDNYLNDEEAAEALGACVENMNYLAVVNIGDCMLGDAGAKRVLDALKVTSPHLLELHLQYNELSTSQVSNQIIELIQIRKNLDKVRLQGNDFNKALKDTLKEMVGKVDREIVLSFCSSGEEEEDYDDEDVEREIEAEEEEEKEKQEEDEKIVEQIKELSLKDD